MECPFHNSITSDNFSEKNFKEFKICFFAHNINEIIYHPFIYKTILCPKVNKKINNCTKENCFYAHDLKEDFRLLPLINRVEINEIIIYSLKNRLFGFNSSHFVCENLNKIKNFCKEKNFNVEHAKEILSDILNTDSKNTLYNIIPSEFNPLTYKLFKCPLESQCKLDVILCLNYHDDNDRRRNPEEFNYGKKLCKNLFDKERKILKNSKYCIDVIFCSI